MKKTNWMLFLSAASANILSFVTGLAYAWTSPVLPKLNGNDPSENSPFPAPITPLEESWITSLLSLGAIFAPFLAGSLIDRIGRKKSLILAAIPALASFLITAFANRVEYYYFARLILGVAVGLTYSLVPIYVAEISEDSNRGPLGCLIGVFYTIGSLFCYAIGPFVTLRDLSLIFVVPLVLFLGIFGFFATESPHFLILTNKNYEAKESLRKIRLGSISKEFVDISNYVGDSKKKSTDTKILLFQGHNLRALLIGVGLMFFQQFSGSSAVVSYLQSIFESAGDRALVPPHISAALTGLIQFLSNLVTIFLIGRTGRKILLAFSAGGALLSHLLLGGYFLLEAADIYWLPVVSVFLFIISYNIGLAPVSWTILGELFQPSCKGSAIALTMMICFVSAFLTTALFPIFIVHFGLASTYFLLAAFCGFGVVFVIFFVPETRGKNLQEIQELLRK